MTIIGSVPAATGAAGRVGGGVGRAATCGGVGPLAIGAGDRFGTGAGYDGPAVEFEGDGKGFGAADASGCCIFAGLCIGASGAGFGASTASMPRGEATGLDGIGAVTGADLAMSCGAEVDGTWCGPDAETGVDG